MKKYKGLLAILILILPTAIYVFLTYGKHNFTHLPYVGPQTDSTYHSIPDFAFVNQFNDTISQSDYEGNIYLTNFVFTTNFSAICSDVFAVLATPVPVPTTICFPVSLLI